jgi:hypothetical protein
MQQPTTERDEGIAIEEEANFVAEFKTLERAMETV